MSNGRYGGSGTGNKSSTDVELAEIRSELRSQGENIAKLTNKIDVMADSVTSMSVQMQHLVTKESCALGRTALADELKKRMDSERDITGVGVPIKDLVKHWASSKGKPSPTPIPYKDRKPAPLAVSDANPEQKAKWNLPTWIGVISGVIAIIVATYGASVFINRTIDRQERTDQILLQIQQTLAADDDGPRKQAPVKVN
jgi:hypothetical protein